MSYQETLFYQLKDLVNSNDKFYMNVSEYKGHRVALFDYRITIPNDFRTPGAENARGSLFEIDENNDFVAMLCLPYEKFFNLHEFGYDSSDGLKDKYQELYGIRVDDDFKNIHKNFKPIYMDKRDGSIISFFSLDGFLECKSNSSLVSDYKYEALSIVESDPLLFDLIKRWTDSGYTVITEYTSSNPLRQIVVPYQETRIVVTGIRCHDDGSYVPYDTIKADFGDVYTVDTVDYIDIESYEQEGIEGYIVCLEDIGMRFKLKTQWYLDRHRVATAITPKQIWKLYLTEELDDMIPFVTSTSVGYFNHVVDKVNALYSRIVGLGMNIHAKYKDCERIEYFDYINSYRKAGVIENIAATFAGNIYNYGDDAAFDSLHELLLIQKYISLLDISSLGDDYE